LEGLACFEEGSDIARGSDVDLGAGKEGDGAFYIDGIAAFDATEYESFDFVSGFEFFLEVAPSEFSASFFAREDGHTVFILESFDIDIVGIAFVDEGFIVSVLSEFADIDPSFGFESDIDKDLVSAYAYDVSFDDGSGFWVMVFDIFFKELSKREVVILGVFFLGGGGVISHEVFTILYYEGLVLRCLRCRQGRSSMEGTLKKDWRDILS
jgi:hypothetical protein